jgi:calcineurin-like phosphoesterase family protein
VKIKKWERFGLQATPISVSHNRDFVWQPRGFESVHDMDEAIVENWNELVSWDDEVYLLGDIMLNNNEEGCKLLNRLAGKIYIIRGNHDTDTRIQEYVNIRPTILYLGLAYMLKYNGYRFYLSHYPTLTANADDDEKPLKKKAISLCGHSHTKDKWYHWRQGLIYHCELDCHDNKPVLIDNIISDLEKQYKLNF